MRYPQRVARGRQSASGRAHRPRPGGRSTGGGARARSPERGGRGRRIRIEERAEGVLRDAGMFRAVAVRDLVDARFGGNAFAAMATLRRLERSGLVEVAEARGPRGGAFRCVGLTEAGRRRLDAQGGAQRWWTGRIGGRQVSHDVAVYRAAAAHRRRIEAEGGRVRRVRIDSEFRSLVARRVERARARGGTAAAEAEVARCAEELRLSLDGGSLHYPDARIEYEDAAGRTGSSDIEVVTEHYRGGAVRAKAAAGFAIHAAGRAAARSAGFGLPRLGGGSGGGGGGAGRADEGLLEL